MSRMNAERPGSWHSGNTRGSTREGPGFPPQNLPEHLRLTESGVDHDLKNLLRMSVCFSLSGIRNKL